MIKSCWPRFTTAPFPVVLAGMRVVRHQHGDPDSPCSPQLRAALGRLVSRDFVQDDPGLVQWCRRMIGA